MIDDGKAMRGDARAAGNDGIARHAEARMRGGLRPGAGAVGDARVEVVHPVHAAGRKNSRRQVFGNELLQFLGKPRRAPCLQQQLRG